MLIRSVYIAYFFVCAFYSGAPAQQEQKARVSFIIGEANLMRSGQTGWENIGLDMSIYKGDRIKTSLNARVEIRMPDETVISINENTIFDVKEIRLAEDEEDEMSFTLWAGNVWAKFKKVVSSRQVRHIDSPSAVVAVRGTTFEMEVDEALSTRVRVEEGQVSVTSKDVPGEVLVGSNEETLVEKGKAPTPPRSLRGDRGSGNAGDLVFDVENPQLQYVDPAVLTAGIPLRGRVVPGAQVLAEDIPLVVTPGGQFRGMVRVQEGLNRIRLTARMGDRTINKQLRVYVNTKRPEIRLSKPLTAGFQNRRDYSLSGAVFDLTPQDNIKVYMNDEAITEVTGRGSFNRTIILQEGENIIKLSAVDFSGNRTEMAERIFLDTVKPIITVTEPASPSHTRFEPPPPPDRTTNLATERFEQIIRGVVLDPEPSSGLKRITVNGKEIRPNSDGSFETRIILKRNENRLRFSAEDVAGNTAVDNSRMIIVK